MMSGRCKNCQLWRPYKGKEPTLPKTKAHACLLRLHERKDKDGNVKLIPSLRDHDDKGPHWGQRTKPGFSCDHFVAKHAPHVRQKAFELPAELATDEQVAAEMAAYDRAVADEPELQVAAE
jgi:hypothetical protein